MARACKYRRAVLFLVPKTSSVISLCYGCDMDISLVLEAAGSEPMSHSKSLCVITFQ